MPGTGDTTAPPAADDHSSAGAATNVVPAFFLTASEQEPDRVGEVALVDPEVSSDWILGRGAAEEDDAAPRVTFVQQRPGSIVDAGPLGGKGLSRRQLRIRVSGDAAHIENTGQAIVVVDGRRLVAGTSRSIEPGALILIRDNCVLLFGRRPRTLPPLLHGVPLHPFGLPDAYGIVGESPATWALREANAAAVLSKLPILIHGETGTGKELVARAIHALSGRDGEFVAANAAAMTETLADSTLFGNAANYPNPGTPESRGWFGQAQGGTLFLDEIGELRVETQARLLRALEGEYMRLGDSRPRKSDVLVVAATNRDRSVLKHDVLRRFAVVIETPSLAERMEDIPLVARALAVSIFRESPKLAAPFVREATSGQSPHVDFAPALVLRMLQGPHEGNVRDLRNLLVDAMTKQREGRLMPPPDTTPAKTLRTIPPRTAARDDDDAELETLLDGFEPSETMIRDEIAKSGGRIDRAAAALGMTRHSLSRRMKKLGIKRK